MLAEKSKVYNLSGQSFEDALFNKQTNPVEGEIEKWMGYMLSEEKKGEKELFLKMLAQNGKIENKDLLSFQRRIKDVLRWIWINTFLFGDRELREEVRFAQNENDIAEFDNKFTIKILAENLPEDLTRKQVRKLLEIVRINLDATKDIDLKSDLIKAQINLQNRYSFLQKQSEEQKANKVYDKTVDKTIPVVEEKKFEKTISKPAATPQQTQPVITNTPQPKLESVTPLTKEERLIANRQKDKLRKKAERSRKKNVDSRYENRQDLLYETDKEKFLENVENLRKITKEQERRSEKEMSETFMNTSDFGRIYVEQRADFIAQTYAGKKRENMLNVFNAMQKAYENGTGSPILQRYFETGKIAKVKGEMTINNQVVQKEADKTVTVNGKNYTLTGDRVAPTPMENKSDLRGIKLYEEVYAQSLSDKKLIHRREYYGVKPITQTRRIVETEVAAAYNMGRLHAMYTNNVQYVRWINDRENIALGKVCMICNVRAVGTSKTLRDKTSKESLAGIYTLEEIMTDRQLAQPQHPHCLCFVRPLTTQEDKIIASVLGIKPGEMVLGATGVAAIGAMGVEGTTNAEIAREGGDRSNWWFGAAKVGAAAVAIGAAYFYLRKSLTSKYAANLMKQRGLNVVEQINTRGLVDIDTVNENTLNQSLKLADDAKINRSTIKPSRPSVKDLGTYPALGIPLPELSELPEVRRQVVENIIVEKSIDKVLVDQTEKAYRNSRIPNERLIPHLDRQFEDITRHYEGLVESYGNDVDIQPFTARAIVETQKDLARIRSMREGIENRLVNPVPETRMDTQTLNNFFNNELVIDLDTSDINLELGGKSFSTTTKRIPRFNISKRFADGGIDKEIVDLQNFAQVLNRKKNITPSEFRRIQTKLRRIEKNRTLTELALTRPDSGLSVLSEIEYYYNDQMEGVLNQTTKDVYEKTLRQKDLLEDVSRKLYELKDATPTYAQKLTRKDNPLKDPFVKNIERITNSSTVKTNAIKGRENAVKTIDSLWKDLDPRKKTTPNIDNLLNLDDMQNVFIDRNYKQKDFKLLPQELQTQLLEQWKNEFKDLPILEQRKLLRKWQTELLNETNRIRTAEFTRFQQKWAMFGSPR